MPSLINFFVIISIFAFFKASLEGPCILSKIFIIISVESGGGCYGCSLWCAEQCLTLLRALASQPHHRTALCRHGLVQELVHHNLHRGTPQVILQQICIDNK